MFRCSCRFGSSLELPQAAFVVLNRRVVRSIRWHKLLGIVVVERSKQFSWTTLTCGQQVGLGRVLSTVLVFLGFIWYFDYNFVIFFYSQSPVNNTASLLAPLCNLLSYGRAFGSVAKHYNYNLSLSKQSKLTKYPAGKQTRVLPNANRKIRVILDYIYPD